MRGGKAVEKGEEAFKVVSNLYVAGELYDADKLHVMFLVVVNVVVVKQSLEKLLF